MGHNPRGTRPPRLTTPAAERHPRANHSLRTMPPNQSAEHARAHDDGTWQVVTTLLDLLERGDHDLARQVAILPMRLPTTCQRTHTKRPKWRCSPTTSAVEGVGPSHPPLPLASSRDDAKALALLHAKMVIHRRNHAALARDWRNTAPVWALALARGAFAPSSFWPWREQLHPPSRNVPVANRHVSLGTPVLCRLPTGPVEQRKSLSNHFKPAHPAAPEAPSPNRGPRCWCQPWLRPLRTLWLPATPTRFPDDQHPTVVAKDVEETATPSGRGSQKRRRSKTRN